MVVRLKILFALITLGVAFSPFAASQNHDEACIRATPGSAVLSPRDLRSHNGVLEIDLALKNSPDSDGNMRYCYVTGDGTISPTLRVNPGDWVILKLRNEVSLSTHPTKEHAHEEGDAQACGGGVMSEAATNLHFHGLSIPPVCHQDETVRTLIPPSATAFEYHFRVPQNAAPGLYWYHPHPHGFSEAQVLGGASGALIVEGIERANRLIAGLPERVFVLRDQAMPAPKPGSAVDPAKPGKDLSINFVPVPYPKYREAVIEMKPSERQFWRVLNASADTYLDLRLLFNGAAQFMGIIALDGVPIGLEDGRPRNKVLWQSHIALPPAGRAEFVVNGPPAGVEARLLTHAITTGTVTSAPGSPPPPAKGAANAAPESALDDDNTPPRPIATIVTSAAAAETGSRLPADSAPFPGSDLAPLSNVQPARQRKLYFSEKLLDPKDPNSPTFFYITEEGKTPAVFDPSGGPNIVVHQGDVEDWVIENRSTETHAFHTHQIHFMVVERLGVPVDEPFLRDTINVPFWDGFTTQYPSLRLRMDFRDANIVGTFPYHCHVLQHEDGGMMGTIRVEASTPAAGVSGGPSSGRSQVQPGASHSGANRSLANHSLANHSLANK